jgi:hypothetical protein
MRLWLLQGHLYAFSCIVPLLVELKTQATAACEHSDPAQQRLHLLGEDAL